MTHHHHHHAEPALAPASLLRLSAAQRLAIVSVLVVLIWSGVFWAWS